MSGGGGEGGCGVRHGRRCMGGWRMRNAMRGVRGRELSRGSPSLTAVSLYSSMDMSRVICCSTTSTSTRVAELPVVSSIGSEPPGVLVVSAAAPGQRKPDSGQRTGRALPSGAQKPAFTGWHAVDDVAPVVLSQVPPGHGCGLALPSWQNEPAGQSTHAVLPSAL